MDLFHQLHYGLAAVLLLIGVEMLGSAYFQIPTGYTLALTVIALAASILFNLATRPATSQPPGQS